MNIGKFPSQAVSHSSVPKAGNPQFFENNKKGEVNELKQLLKNTLNEKDQNKRREVIKKVIAFMTLGLDVSRLFSEMCMASYTNDLIQKKMIYLYLGNYAESHPELAVMAINTYLKDCQHTEAKIRGLAIRSLCSLRFSGSFEYLMPVIINALADTDSYVKKTAIMGCIKLYYMAPDVVKKSNLVETLYSLIHDNDPLVIQNSIEALNEILFDEGGVAISSKMVIYLLNRIKEFNEWGQSVILELVSKYKPKTENEMFDIMNLLEDRLKHACISIVLGCIKVFLVFTKDNENLHQQVYKRVQNPLITLMTSGEVNGAFESTFIVLNHIYYIVKRGGNAVFENDFKHFYCKVDEPTYIKQLKLNILTQIASELNLGDILNELGEYVTDIDQEIAGNSIQALGGVALRLPKMAVPIIKQLTTFISMQNENVTNVTIVAFGNILRKYPNEYKEIISVLTSALELITSTDAKIALIWILGEFGQHFDEAPYILENMINSMKENNESLRVKHILLTSSVKLFFKRAPEMQSILANIFNNILGNEEEDIDLKDRATFYYLALKNNLKELETLLNSGSGETGTFVEDEEASKESENFDFNTLSVIYQKPAEKFTKSFEHFSILRNKENALLYANTKPAETPVAETETETAESQQQAPEIQRTDLLDVDIAAQGAGDNNNLLELNFAPAMGTIALGDLIENFELESDDFQSGWMNLNEGATKTKFLNSAALIGEKEIEALFSQHRMYCIASGEMDGEIKFYFYSKHKSENLILVECQLNTIAKVINLSIKSQDDDLAAFFAKYVEDIFTSIGLI